MPVYVLHLLCKLVFSQLSWYCRCACPVGVPIEGPFNLLLTCQPLKVVGRTVVGIVRGRKDQEVDDLEEAERVAGGEEDEAFDLDLDDKKFFPPE